MDCLCYVPGHTGEVVFPGTPTAVQPSNAAPFAIPDTGARTSFATGAVRDASIGKGLPHCIPPVAIRKLAVRFEAGAEKYKLHNWMAGIPLSRFVDAIMRHTMAHAEGKTDEDHMGAMLWNCAAMAWTEEAIADGRLPAELDDLPFRIKAKG